MTATMFLREPIMVDGARVDYLVARSPTHAEMVTAHLQVTTARPNDRVTPFMVRTISTMCGIPEAAVDEMAVDDAERVYAAIATIFTQTKERNRA